MKGLIDKIRKALGDENKALADELATAAEAALSEADAAAAAKRDADKALKAAEARAAKLAKDLEAKAAGESEEVAKLRTERDKLTADLESAKGEAGKVRLDYALRDAARAAGIVDPDAIKMLDVSGVSLGDDGKLVGFDAVAKAAKASKPYLFGEPAPAVPQLGTGAAPKPGDARGGTAPNDPKTAARQFLAMTDPKPKGAGWGIVNSPLVQPPAQSQN